jgi:hypothetical protein
MKNEEETSVETLEFLLTTVHPLRPSTLRRYAIAARRVTNVSYNTMMKPRGFNILCQSRA